MKVLLIHIKELLQVHQNPPQWLAGEEMGQLPILRNAWLLLNGDLIEAYGPMEDWGGITDWRNLEVIDAEGRFVMPAFCDSHTHTVFARSREEEFVDRINGLSYEEIANRGGGILNSAKKSLSKPLLPKYLIRNSSKVLLSSV